MNSSSPFDEYQPPAGAEWHGEREERDREREREREREERERERNRETFICRL